LAQSWSLTTQYRFFERWKVREGEMKRVALLFGFYLEACFWLAATSPLANVAYASFLAIPAIPISVLLGMPAVYLPTLVIVLVFVLNPRRRLIKLRNRRAAYWDRIGATI
jgi:fumarate reductase subunit C